MPEILVKVRDTFGQARVYPDCDTAQLLARLAGTKTFEARHLRTIRALGYTITHRADCSLAARSALADV